jgi:hypothetical protein
MLSGAIWAIGVSTSGDCATSRRRAFSVFQIDVVNDLGDWLKREVIRFGWNLMDEQQPATFRA